MRRMRSVSIDKRFNAMVWDDDLMEVDQIEMLVAVVQATLLDDQLVFGFLTL
jgi:hypothetical protein